MNKNYVAGIDPGLRGAIAYLNLDTGGMTILDMPTRQRKMSTGKMRNEIDTERLAERLDRADMQLVIIEAQSVRPGESAARSLKTGYGMGLLVGAIAANYHRFEIVYPQTWKKRLSVPKDKTDARFRASHLMPQMSHKWANAGQDGRAEAALLALYGLLALDLPLPGRGAVRPE